MKFTRNLDRAILRELVQGATLQQVAHQFDLTVAEVTSCRRHICRKLRLNRPTVREYSQAVGLLSPGKAG